MANEPSKKAIINDAFIIRETLKEYGFYNYSGLFQMYYPDKYRDPRNKKRLKNFFCGQVNDREMLKDARKVLRFVVNTSSKRSIK